MSDPVVEAGYQHCLFGNSERHCGSPATVHTLIRGGPTMSCAGHAYRWKTWPYVAQHPIGGACGLPNAEWRTLPDGTSHCAIEGLTEADLAVGAVVGPDRVC